jgi:hypothetical protein
MFYFYSNGRNKTDCKLLGKYKNCELCEKAQCQSTCLSFGKTLRQQARRKTQCTEQSIQEAYDCVKLMPNTDIHSYLQIHLSQCEEAPSDKQDENKSGAGLESEGTFTFMVSEFCTLKVCPEYLFHGYKFCKCKHLVLFILC